MIHHSEKDALGENPQGIISYRADGRMFVFVLRSDGAMPRALVSTAEEKIRLYDAMFAYAGTYMVEHDRVIHHLDMSWNKVWEGTEQVRFVETDGRTLSYRSAPAKNPFDGRDCIHIVRYEKIALPQH